MSIPKFKIKLEQGIIKVNSVIVLQATESVVWLSADCEQKYPDADWGSSCLLTAGDDTLGITDPKAYGTIIEAEGLDEDDGWRMVSANAGRYNVDIIYVRSILSSNESFTKFKHLHLYCRDEDFDRVYS